MKGRGRGRPCKIKMNFSPPGSEKHDPDGKIVRKPQGPSGNGSEEVTMAMEQGTATGNDLDLCKVTLAPEAPAPEAPGPGPTQVFAAAVEPLPLPKFNVWPFVPKNGNATTENDNGMECMNPNNSEGNLSSLSVHDLDPGVPEFGVEVEIEAPSDHGQVDGEKKQKRRRKSRKWKYTNWGDRPKPKKKNSQTTSAPAPAQGSQALLDDQMNAGEVVVKDDDDNAITDTDNGDADFGYEDYEELYEISEPKLEPDLAYSEESEEVKLEQDTPFVTTLNHIFETRSLDPGNIILIPIGEAANNNFTSNISIMELGEQDVIDQGTAGGDKMESANSALFLDPTTLCAKLFEDEKNPAEPPPLFTIVLSRMDSITGHLPLLQPNSAVSTVEKISEEAKTEGQVESGPPAEALDLEGSDVSNGDEASNETTEFDLPWPVGQDDGEDDYHYQSMMFGGDCNFSTTDNEDEDSLDQMDSEIDEKEAALEIDSGGEAGDGDSIDANGKSDVSTVTGPSDKATNTENGEAQDSYITDTDNCKGDENEGVCGTVDCDSDSTEVEMGCQLGSSSVSPGNEDETRIILSVEVDVAESSQNNTEQPFIPVEDKVECGDDGDGDVGECIIKSSSLSENGSEIDMSPISETPPVNELAVEKHMDQDFITAGDPIQGTADNDFPVALSPSPNQGEPLDLSSPNKTTIPIQQASAQKPKSVNRRLLFLNSASDDIKTKPSTSTAAGLDTPKLRELEMNSESGAPSCQVGVPGHAETVFRALDLALPELSTVSDSRTLATSATTTTTTTKKTKESKKKRKNSGPKVGNSRTYTWTKVRTRQAIMLEESLIRMDPETRNLLRQAEIIAANPTHIELIGGKLYCEPCNRFCKVYTGPFKIYHKYCAAMELGLPSPFWCSLCRRSFRNRTHRKYHVYVHTDERPYVCGECTSDFNTPSKLNRHVRIVHEGYKPGMCDICGKGFSSTEACQKHAQLHVIGRKPEVPCPVCDKKFMTRESMKKHKARAHDSGGQKPFACPICAKPCATEWQLTCHRRIHSGEPIFDCDECGRKFKQHRDLERHKNTHLGIKPYMCAVCTRECSRLDNIKRHVTNVHKATEEEYKRMILRVGVPSGNLGRAYEVLGTNGSTSCTKRAETNVMHVERPISVYVSAETADKSTSSAPSAATPVSVMIGMETAKSDLGIPSTSSKVSVETQGQGQAHMQKETINNNNVGKEKKGKRKRKQIFDNASTTNTESHMQFANGISEPELKRQSTSMETGKQGDSKRAKPATFPVQPNLHEPNGGNGGPSRLTITSTPIQLSSPAIGHQIPIRTLLLPPMAYPNTITRAPFGLQPLRNEIFTHGGKAWPKIPAPTTRLAMRPALGHGFSVVGPFRNVSLPCSPRSASTAHNAAEPMPTNVPNSPGKAAHVNWMGNGNNSNGIPGPGLQPNTSAHTVRLVPAPGSNPWPFGPYVYGTPSYNTDTSTRNHILTEWRFPSISAPAPIRAPESTVTQPYQRRQPGMEQIVQEQENHLVRNVVVPQLAQQGSGKKVTRLEVGLGMGIETGLGAYNPIRWPKIPSLPPADDAPSFPVISCPSNTRF